MEKKEGYRECRNAPFNIWLYRDNKRTNLGWCVKPIKIVVLINIQLINNRGFNTP